MPLFKASPSGMFMFVMVDDDLGVPVVSQNKEDCGPCCAGLVVLLFRPDLAAKVTPQAMRTLSQRHAGGYRPSPADVVRRDAMGNLPAGLGTAMNLLKQGMEDRFGKPLRKVSYIGQTGASLVATLHDLTFAGSAFKNTRDIRTKLAKATLARPYIVAVNFTPSSRHWVVVCGYRAQDSHYLVSDPVSGAGWLPLGLPAPNEQGPVYAPEPGARGILGGDYITVKK